MSAQAPLTSLTETSLVSLLVSVLEASCEQPKLPAIISVIMTALKPIDINLFLPKFLYTNSPNIAQDNVRQTLYSRSAGDGRPEVRRCPCPRQLPPDPAP